MYSDCSHVVDSSAELSSMDDGGSNCSMCEFIDIPCNGWAREGLFAVNGLGTDVPVLASSDENLGTKDFSYARL